MTFLSPDKIKVFQRRLANLSSRNRSLVLLSLPQEQFIDIHTLDFLSGTSSFQLITACIQGKSGIPLCEVHDPRYDKINEASKRLRQINRTDTFIEMERGSEDLYLGWPIVQGKFTDGTVVRAPLLFWPVSLRVTPANKWVLDRRDEPVSVNRSFVMAYAHFNDVSLPEEYFEKTFEDFPADAREFRTALYEWLKSTSLSLDFNSDLFEDQLQFFPKLLKSDLERTERNGELKLISQAILGIFPQADSYLVRDYDTILQSTETIGEWSDLIREEVPHEEEKKIREADILTPFPMDASQESAFRRIKSGESVVVQGPPGTGKSQLICNLVADFTATGKRVLVVSQKRAALDTVYERLSRAGLQNFVANLHDFQRDRKSLYTQIAQQIDRVEEYRKLNSSLDAILLEREFLQTAHQIDRLQAELQEFRTLLFDASVCGVSAKELYLTSNPNRATLNVSAYYQQFPLHALEETLLKLRRYEAYRQRISDQHPWADRVDFSAFTFRDVARISDMIRIIPSAVDEWQNHTKQWVGRKLSWRELTELVSNRSDWDKIKSVCTEGLDPWIHKIFRKQIEEWSGWSEKAIIDKYISEEFLGDTHRSSQLAELERRLNLAIQARNSPFKWLFFGDKDYIRTEAAQYGLSTSGDDLAALRIKLKNRYKAEAMLRNWEEKAGVTLVSDQWSVTIQNWERAKHSIAGASEAYTLLKNGPAFSWEMYRYEPTQFLAHLPELIRVTQDIAARMTEWKTNLTTTQIERIHQNPEWAERILIPSLQQDMEFLQEFDQLQHTLTSAEKDVVQQAAPRTDSLPETFTNSIRLAWLEHLETLYPLLRSVSGLKMDQMEEELQAAVIRKEQLAGEIGHMRLREQTYRHLETNRLGNVVTYRDLKHQVTKKRLIWPVRQVLTTYTDEIFSVVPCWLSSPETVSAIFPFQNGEKPLFDLVIFDEASQCFAEQGLPAMLRAPQVVIAGDSKQLQPSDLYRVRFEEDTNDTPELEVTSLLELMARQLPQVLLQGHYRSRSLDLIDFSNQHFYQNRLQLLPDFSEMNSHTGSIQYIKVEGEWKNQTNEAEADAVVELLETLQHSNQSIGVVTFNLPQQRLLEDKLANRIRPESLFIKNLENVQGDERDIIIFSIAYAPDANGKVPAQFGSLSQSGGENRLNVAITRARQQIYVVTSIWPEQLRVEETLNEGPKLLKAYLNFARKVSDGQYKPQPRVAEELKSSQLLKDQLQKVRPDWINELPFADLVQKEGKRYESLVLTDDDLYYQSLSSKEAHAYFPISLRKKGWKFQRIWSREWWRKS